MSETSDQPTTGVKGSTQATDVDHVSFAREAPDRARARLDPDDAREQDRVWSQSWAHRTAREKQFDD